MMAVITYLIKFSLSLTFVYAFYALLLKRLTFYNWNRLFLLSYSLACFFIPFINLGSWLNKPENSNAALQAIPPFNQLVPAITANSINQIIVIFFITGCATVLLKLFIQYLSLRQINKNAVLLHREGNLHIYSTNAGCSFSSGNNIYLDTTANHSPNEIEKVLQHEMIHVKQKHWIDLLAGELLCIVNWFNPFAWLMRAAIRQNLEYIADRQVLRKGYDSKEYQYLLLKISTTNRVGIAAHFSLSGLKNRIYMINKIKSARVHLSKFALIFPLMLLLLFAFRTVKQSPIYIGVISDTIPGDTTKDSILIGVVQDNIIGVKDSKKYKKPPKPPVPPVPPVPVPAPPPPPVQPAESAKPAQPAVPAAPVPPVPPLKEKNK